MREIKFLGTYRKEGVSRSYQYSLFECPACLNSVERIRKDGIKANGCCHNCSRLGKNRGSYNEKVFISGYHYIYKPNHPNATKSGYVAEHRLVAEQSLGRFLKEDEIVHHINCNKLDNGERNLKVMTASEHIKLHAKMRRRKKDGKFAI